MTVKRRERRFTMNLRTGRIVDPDAPAVRGRDEDDWRPIGELDPATGRSTVDLEKSRRWRPLSEWWRWR